MPAAVDEVMVAHHTKMLAVVVDRAVATVVARVHGAGRLILFHSVGERGERARVAHAAGGDDDLQVVLYCTQHNPNCDQ